MPKIYAAAGSMLVATLACAGSSTRGRDPIQPAAPAASAPDGVRLPDRGWATVSVEALALSIDLPDAASWTHTGGRDWVGLAHAATDSRLELRRVRADRAPRPETCRSLTGLGAPPPVEELVDERVFEGRDGVHWQLLARVRPSAEGAAEGELLAVGAGYRLCLALRLRTRVNGAGREDELARRLLLFAERSVSSVSVRSVEDRVTSGAGSSTAP